MGPGTNVWGWHKGQERSKGKQKRTHILVPYVGYRQDHPHNGAWIEKGELIQMKGIFQHIALSQWEKQLFSLGPPNVFFFFFPGRVNLSANTIIQNQTKSDPIKKSPGLMDASAPGAPPPKTGKRGDHVFVVWGAV